MITATEARQLASKLASNTVEEKVEKLSSTIEKLAKANKRRLRTEWDYDDNRDLWTTGGYETSEEWINAKKILENYGYKVSFYYDDRGQFVDMYTLIEW